jgi:hypothetical protein
MKMLGRQSKQALVILGAIAALAACSSSGGGGTTSGGDGGTSSGGGEGGGGTPSITISSPTDGSSVAVTKNGTEEDIPVAFHLSNFTLAAAGTCPGGASNTGCGHIHVVIDDASSCGGPPYNNVENTGSPATAIVSKCATVNGSHKLQLELHYDDHSAVPGAGAVSAVTVTVTGG